jgi:lysozyme
VRPGQRITAAEAEQLLVEDLAPVEAAIARSITVPLTGGQHGALVSFAFNLGHSTAAGKPLANIAATLNRGDYDGALRRMGLNVKQRRNGRLVTVPGLVNRRAAEAGLWARGEFVASRHVAPAAPPTEGAEAAKLGGYAAAAATAAPALQALAGVPVWIGVALVLAVAVVAVAVLMRRERAA